jgi:hypothetical protein
MDILEEASEALKTAVFISLERQYLPKKQHFLAL